METYLENLGQLARTVLGEPGGGAAAGAAADAEVEVEAAPTSPVSATDGTGPTMLEPVTPPDTGDDSSSDRHARHTLNSMVSERISRELDSMEIPQNGGYNT